MSRKTWGTLSRSAPIYIYIYSNNINFSADMDPILILFRKNLDSPFHFRQLTKVHRTFASIPSGLSPLANVLLAKIRAPM